jgi:hypothetical protein
MKRRFRGIKGRATLTPPAQGTPALQSSASMAIIDMLGEGPIDGLVKQNGKRAEGINLLEGVFLDDTRVKEPDDLAPISGESLTGLKFNSVQLIDRLTTGSMNEALDNIKNNLALHSGLNENNEYLHFLRTGELESERQDILDFIEENSGYLGQFGLIQFNIDEAFGTGLFARTKSANFDNFSVRSYNVTRFEPDIYFNETEEKRVILTDSDDSVEVPASLFYHYPLFNNDLPGGYASANNKTEIFGGAFKFRTSGLAGGGIAFFYIGNAIATGDAGVFDTGKFFVATNDADITGVIGSGQDGGYDVFVYDNSSQLLSLDNVSRKQVYPEIGEIDGTDFNIGIISDLNSQYNYTNFAFDFRKGYEFQPFMEGYQEAAQDFDVKKMLLGPLATERDDAAQGEGQGYKDIRGGGDFSSWRQNLPLDHEPYPYTHRIKRIDVKKCYPTIAIEQLFDTIATGDDAGEQKSATVAFAIDLNFDGKAGHTGVNAFGQNSTDHTGLNELTLNGNSLRDVVLGRKGKSIKKTVQGIATTIYLKTFSDIPDLPKNSELKDLRYTPDDITDLTQEILDRDGSLSGELIFPDDSWKEVERTLTVTKLSYETDSTLIAREISLSYVTEIVGEDFSYPFANLAASTFDARTFARQPTRAFDARFKKVLIPSNYNPLRGDGSDKRFIDSSSNYGKRSIYEFNSGSYFESPTKISCGQDDTLTLSGKFSVNNDPGTTDVIFQTNTGSDSFYHQLNFQVQSNGIFFFGTSGDATNGPQTTFTNLVNIPSLIGLETVLEFKAELDVNKATLKVNNLTDGNSYGGDASFYSRTFNTDIDPTDGKSLFIGASINENQIASGSKIVDLKIQKNNQLINKYDGTIKETIRFGKVLFDRINGDHAQLIGTYNTVVADNDFDFGRNKELIYNGHWDGTFKLGWTDNPAWILYDLMINPIYGVGNALDDREDINIFKLFEFARHCDAVDSEGNFDGVPDSQIGLEPRFSCNLKISENKNAFEVLSNIASVFRGISFWDGASLSFSMDKEKDVAAIFNNHNVYDGLFNYADVASTARFTRVEVFYADAKNDYIQKSEYVEDEERIRKYGIITKANNGIGCTSKSQARRLGKYVLLSNKLETEICQFQCGNEAMLLEPGDVIRVDDDLKHFEISYAKILGVTRIPTGVYIEDIINTGSIKTGSSEGGLHTYNFKQQQELSSLYDIVNFNQLNDFTNQDDFLTGRYSGVLPIEQIEQMDYEQITRHYITSIQRDSSGIFLGLGSSLTEVETIRTGTYANIELNTNITTEYKIVKKTEVDKNRFEIQGLQYERNKFNMIEAEDFDIVENNYNIGIPEHTINRPSAPTVETGSKIEPDSSTSITGVITKAAGSNETSYRVTVFRKNMSGPYFQKEFLKESDDTTDFKIENLKAGTYSLTVTALRNPESSQNYQAEFTILGNKQVYIKDLIKNIELKNNTFSVYERNNGSGLGSGNSVSDDCEYSLSLVNKKNENITINNSDYTYNIYASNSGEFETVKTGYNSDSFVFTEAKNILAFGGYFDSFDIKFNLMKGSNIIDTACFKTTTT